MKPMTFKQICELISDVTTYEQVQEVYGQIDFSFQKGKITWKDHQILYHITDKIDVFHK